MTLGRSVGAPLVRSCECVHSNDMRVLAVDGDQRQSVDDSKHSRMMATKELIIAMFRT